MDINEITQLLQRHRRGEGDQLDRVFAALYKDIRALAGHQLKNLRPGHTITPTALANECYLKLAEVRQLPPLDRRHFMHYLGKAMRRYLIDELRGKQSQKRKGQNVGEGLSELVGDSDIQLRVLDIERMLDRVEAVDPQLAEVLQCKLIFNLTHAEIAELMQVTERHAVRLWTRAKALLLSLLGRG